jgi:putative hydrolase of the HAD superfamily
MSGVTYRGLILDFGGVVTTDFYGALSAFCTREGLDSGAFLHVLRDTAEGREALAAVECGQMPQREYEQVIGRLLGLPDTGLLARALADLKPRPEVLELTRRARAAGIRTAALSNSWGIGGYAPYDGYDLDGLFDAVVISDQVGLRKPSPEIYQLTAAKIGLPAGECLFVDDTPANLPQAAELGMGTLLFTGAAGDVAKMERLTGLA